VAETYNGLKKIMEDHYFLDTLATPRQTGIYEAGFDTHLYF
jgi:hypothetical protein